MFSVKSKSPGSHGEGPAQGGITIITIIKAAIFVGAILLLLFVGWVKFGDNSGSIRQKSKNPPVVKEESVSKVEGKPLGKPEIPFELTYHPVWKSEIESDFKKFISWDLSNTLDTSQVRFEQNLTKFIEKAKTLAKREGGVAVTVKENSKEYKFNAIDAVDMYIYLSQNGKKEASFVILNQDDSMATGKLKSESTFKVVHLNELPIVKSNVEPKSK